MTDKATTIAEAFQIAANIARNETIKMPYISKEWTVFCPGDPTKAIAYTHADRIAELIEAEAEKYDGNN